MMLWEFADCIEGWNRAQGGEEKPPSITDSEFDDMLKRHGYA